MKTKAILLIFLLVCLSNCATPPKFVTIKQKFDSDQARTMLAKGNNSIHGSSLIRQSGGNIVTCAGNPVVLIPSTEYAIERMEHLYGDESHGYNPLVQSQRIVFVNEHPLYNILTKEVLCDVQGFFKFDNIADGTFYVISEVIWTVGKVEYQGGHIMQEVVLEGGESKEIVLAP